MNGSTKPWATRPRPRSMAWPRKGDSHWSGLMDLDWSEQSPHIRTLYRPWQQGDGYEEDVIAAAEARCGVRLSVTLRSFYRMWGRRQDLTRMNEVLLAPDEWVVHAGALIFCVENQSCWYWALPLAALTQADPPVVQAESGRERAVWGGEDDRG